MALRPMKNLVKQAVQFVKVGDVNACASCGASVDPQFFQRHRQWHQNNDI